MRNGVIILLMVLTSTSVFAQKPYSQNFINQEQSPQQKHIFNDSAKWDDPKKATVLALALPGAGQIYNKKYWKAGIVYAGIGGLVYMYKYNTDSLKKYQAILTSKIDGDSTTPDLAPNRSQPSITSDRDFHRRYRDISIIGFVGLYALQVIDANVDAHLKEFKVNKDLSMRIRPEIYSNKNGLGRYNGLSVSLKF